MLTKEEAWRARTKLAAALALIVEARIIYADAGYVPGIRGLNGLSCRVDDEIAALTKIIADINASNT